MNEDFFQQLARFQSPNRYLPEGVKSEFWECVYLAFKERMMRELNLLSEDGK